MPSGTEVRRHRRKRSRTSWLVWAIPLALVLIGLGVGLWFFLNTYLVVGGQVYRRDSQQLDLREKHISVETFEKLTEKLPDCEILWNVPLSGGEFDCTAKSITLPAFSPEDVNLLDYFTELGSIDAVGAPLTVEDFTLLRSAAPQCDIRWSVPIGGAVYPSDESSIVLQGLSSGDLANFSYFDDLRAVDARVCTDYAAIMALREERPALELLWSVPLSGTEYAQDATELLVDDPAVTAAALAEAITYLPEVQSVNAPENNWTEEEKADLMERFPEISFRWPVTILGTLYRGDTTEIDLSGKTLSTADVQDLVKKGVNLPLVERIDLTGCGVGLTEEMFQLREVFPEAEIIFDFELYGVPINSMDTLVEFNGIEMTSTDAVESMLPFMPHLEKVDMSACGFDDETMDALNKKYEDVRFVWTLYITYYSIRTDDIGFRATSRHYGVFTEESVQRLRYCEDMICMDLGHRQIKDISFLYGMPHLKYLLLLDARMQDLTPISACKELIWLEMNRSSTPSIAALLECPSIRDLNITFMDFCKPEETFETLMNMPWLERVWFSRAMLSTEQEAKLQEAHPDIMYHVVYTWPQSNQDPWRYDQDYYDMRDVLNMFYMNEEGRITYKIIDGVRYDLDPEFLAQQGNTDHDMDRTQQ